MRCRAGSALTATLGGASVLNLGGERRARPNLVGDPDLPASERTISAGSTRTPSPRSARRRRRSATPASASCADPDSANFDFTFAKDFRLGDRRRFQFRSEIFNAFNRTNFGPPNIRANRAGSDRF